MKTATQRRAARFNRSFANHIVGPALTALPGFGMVYHRGRRTGRAYRTPVKVFRHGPDWVISLPYGRDSDWTRNVLAAGGCELRTGRRRIRLAEPRLLDSAPGGVIPVVLRRMLNRVGCTDFLVLSPAQPSIVEPSTVEIVEPSTVELSTMEQSAVERRP